MKKSVLFLPVLALSLVLCSCDNDSWKKEYGTPELFIESVLNSLYNPDVYMYENQNHCHDDDFIIASHILELGPFEKSAYKKHSDRYFTYQAYWQPATSGPNYCNMSIWDDGFIVIRHKMSLGRLQSVYFTMDSTNASELVDYVFDWINENIIS